MAKRAKSLTKPTARARFLLAQLGLLRQFHLRLVQLARRDSRIAISLSSQPSQHINSTSILTKNTTINFSSSSGVATSSILSPSSSERTSLPSRDRLG
ncbi:unnamed protein product [Protopolystoma xenopodis]|uniref:Uncharacterized protein n=1 Tax=Protopolystoma xenopodis TaxID=117903 RepID=A0A3S4ZYZ1_9PLAT|nr:unnamed protein product [Protopolystoma xenopodis]